MFKISVLIWIVLGVVLAGVGVMFVLNWPAFAGQELRLIPIAAIAGYVVAIPFAALIARAIARRAA